MVDKMWNGSVTQSYIDEPRARNYQHDVSIIVRLQLGL
jgi:hypothetical protein